MIYSDVCQTAKLRVKGANLFRSPRVSFSKKSAGAALKNYFLPSVFVPTLVYRRDYAGQVGGLLSAKTTPKITILSAIRYPLYADPTSSPYYYRS